MSFTWPTTRLAGTLPRKNASREEADPHLTEELVDPTARWTAKPSPYLENSYQGADMRPRSLCIVEPAADAAVIDRDRPFVQSAQQVVAAATKNWKDVALEGRVEAKYLYATALSVEPYRLGPLQLAALPIVLAEQGTGVVLRDHSDILGHGDTGMADWVSKMQTAFEAWLARTNKQPGSRVVQYLNTQHKLSRHRPNVPRVVWGKGGSNVRTAVIPERLPDLHGIPVRGYVVDLNQYFVECSSWDEAHYICAFLNTDLVNAAIKGVQTVGEQGERDIHRRPVEQVPIPKYQPTNDGRHLELQQLARHAHRLAQDITVSSSRARNRYYQGLASVAPRIEELVTEIIAEQ